MFTHLMYRLNQKGLYRRQIDSSDEEKECGDETEVGSHGMGGDFVVVTL